LFGSIVRVFFISMRSDDLPAALGRALKMSSLAFSAAYSACWSLWVFAVSIKSSLADSAEKKVSRK